MEELTLDNLVLAPKRHMNAIRVFIWMDQRKESALGMKHGVA